MSIRINGKKYINGTVVRANPVEEATGTLEKIGIGSDVYDIAVSGGGSSGVYVEDELYTATSNSFVDITVDWGWKDYDFYNFRVHDTYSENGDTTILTKGQILSMVSSGNHQYFFRFGSSNCSYVFTSSQLTARANGDGLFIEQIVGIKVSGDYYSPVIYSTEEREIGVWTDNKPLYQKTWTGLSITPAYNTWTNIIQVSDIDKIIAWEGRDNGTVCLNGTGLEISYNSATQYVRGEYTQNSNIRLVETLTLQYTKTTDTAGSGSYNTLGVPTVHYTTDEQVIGTWIDGKPLYRRTWNFSTGVTVSSNSWQATDIAVADTHINIITDCKALNDDGQMMNYISATTDLATQTYVMIFNSRTNAGMVVKYLTLEYTKTTDQ